MATPYIIIGLDHVVLRARDPAALEKFYIDVLGCTLELRQDTLAQLRAGRTLIDIVPADREGPAQGTSSTGGANLDHLCLRVEPFDAAAIAAHLATYGVRCGDEAQRYGAEGRGPSIYLNDPEGTGVELKGPVQG
jgi:glyoxylase I family protein